jgi:hypothetical protein
VIRSETGVSKRLRSETETIGLYLNRLWRLRWSCWRFHDGGFTCISLVVLCHVVCHSKGFTGCDLLLRGGKGACDTRHQSRSWRLEVISLSFPHPGMLQSEATDYVDKCEHTGPRILP